ncbi:mucin-like protein [Watersipora subatra]|uniref:mucin-like protein n=1 Tax=Watersipora subatra TaxID=2589382 RepID=UPI00355B1C2E
MSTDSQSSYSTETASDSSQKSSYSTETVSDSSQKSSYSTETASDSSQKSSYSTETASDSSQKSSYSTETASDSSQKSSYSTDALKSESTYSTEEHSTYSTDVYTSDSTYGTGDLYTDESTYSTGDFSTDESTYGTGDFVTDFSSFSTDDFTTDESSYATATDEIMGMSDTTDPSIETTVGTTSRSADETTTDGQADSITSNTTPDSEDATQSTTSLTTNTAAYSWTEPAAWSSSALYPYGESEGDTDMLADVVSRDSYDLCDRVRLNGRVGAAFYKNRYYYIYVCNNGMLTFNQPIREDHPSVFGSNLGYINKPVIAPFWSKSDEVTLSLLADSWPQARTRVFYNTYDSRDGGNDAIFTRAANDVANSDVGVADFQPTWLLVATWLNVADQRDNCRSTSINYYRTGSSVGDCATTAEELAINHFQAVFMTDGVYSFVKYNYPEDGIQWAYPGVTTTNLDMLSQIAENSQTLTGMAIGGLISGDGLPSTTINLDSSNTFNFVNIDSLPGNMKDGAIGEYLFRVETSDGTKTPELRCVQWVDGEDADFYSAASQSMPCPTNIFSMFIESIFGGYRFESFDWTLLKTCFRSSFPRDDIVQRCCYIDSFRSIFNGVLISFPPHGGYVSNVNLEAEEETAYDTCCNQANMCRLFYGVRPSNDGSGYEPPAFWPWFGDPHITTSDGLTYTFNGLGEYLFTNIDNGSTIIQARTEKVVLDDGSFGQATYFSAICVKTTGLPKVQVQLNRNNNLAGVVNELQLIIDGQETDISLIEQDSNVTQTITGVDSSLMFKRTNSSLTVIFSSGVTVTSAVAHRMITITLGLPSSAKGKTIGLTGLFDGDQSNDLTFPNGSAQIAVDFSESEVFDWASSFSISEGDSIMYYTDNTNWYTFNNNSFVPVFTDDIDNWVWSSEELRTSAYAACNNDTACLYDVYITGSLDIGLSTKSTAEESIAQNDALGNYAPVLEGADSFIATVGQEWFYTVTVNDSNGDAFTIDTNVESTVVIDGTQVNITGTLSNVTGFSLIVTAKDPSGAAGTKTPLAMICNCANGGVCVELSEEEQAEIETSSVVLTCICPAGYTGDLCDADLNACELVASPCYPSVLCVDLPPPADYSGYTCGDCPAGYTGDGKTCTDVDECTEDVCGHICINSPGSFVCACRTGYTLNIDGSTCDDINECLTDPCHQSCNNTEGSYVCSCDSGFVLTSDNINCEPDNPCEDPNPCDATNGYCNTVGDNKECSCKKGYTLNADGSTCDEIDECLLGTHHCAQVCNNTVGGYTCSCESGYSLASNGLDCDDVNECVQSTFSCHSSQICANTAGGYECTCSSGQIAVNGTCQNIVYTDPVVIESPDTPIDETYRTNAVSFSFSGLAISEYTVEKEITLFTLLASSANTKCTTSSCWSRRKRSTGSVTFYKEHFSRLPGYPQENNGDLDMVIYSLVPGSGVLTSELLKQVVEDAAANITAAIGADVTNIALHVTPTTTTSTAAVTTTQTAVETTVSEAKNMSGAYIAIGVTGGLLLIAAVVVIVMIKLKKSKNSKTTPIQDSEEPARASPVTATNFTKTDLESTPSAATSTPRPVTSTNNIPERKRVESAVSRREKEQGQTSVNERAASAVSRREVEKGQTSANERAASAVSRREMEQGQTSANERAASAVSRREMEQGQTSVNERAASAVSKGQMEPQESSAQHVERPVSAESKMSGRHSQEHGRMSAASNEGHAKVD